VTFNAMASSRSDMLALTRRLDEALPGKQAGFAKKLASLADESMMDAAEKSGIPGLPDAIRNANDLTRETHKMFEQQLVKRIVASKRPTYISTFITAKGVDNEETRNLMTMLPEEVKQPVRRQIVMDSIQRSINKDSGMFDERLFARDVLKIGDERGEIVFGKNWKNVKELANVMGKINGPAGLSAGSGAALQNAGILNDVLKWSAAIPVGLSAAGKFEDAAIAVGAGASALALRAGAYKTLAAAITNPETALKVVNFARRAARVTPYVASGGYEVGKGQTKATRDLKSIRNRALYKHIAKNSDGHTIGSNDGQSWSDVETGEPVDAQ
jgi:hypothetical protein